MNTYVPSLEPCCGDPHMLIVDRDGSVIIQSSAACLDVINIVTRGYHAHRRLVGVDKRWIGCLLLYDRSAVVGVTLLCGD